MPAKIEPLTVAEVDLAEAMVKAQSGHTVSIPRTGFERFLVTAKKGAQAFAAEYEANHRAMMGVGRIT